MNFFQKSLYILSLLIPLPCFTSLANTSPCISNAQIQTAYAQWFTGPVVTPNPTTVPPTHPGLEFVLIGSNNYGFYDSRGKLKHIPNIWGIRPLLDLQIGLNAVLGLELIGSMITNYCQGSSSTNLSDSIFRVGFQVLTDKKDSWAPDLRILVQETFPTGNYEKLSPAKKGTDSSGQGSYQSGIQCVFQKAFHMNKKASFRLRGCFGYFMPSSVKVRGNNYYGGESSTKGTVYPGNYFSTFFHGEYAIGRRWAIACELNYLQGDKGKFYKREGKEIHISSFRQISFLPEIQHTYTENVGIVLGAWTTIAGKNSSAFSKIFGAILLLF